MRSRTHLIVALIIGLAILAAGFLSTGATETAQVAVNSATRPDLTGVWQSITTANWDIQDHSAAPGPTQFGALFAEPPGLGIVEGGEIPYRPEAAEKKKENYKKRFTEDPEAKCYLPGVPRATYMPYPFQIVQTPQYILIAYEFAGAVRTVHINEPKPNPIDIALDSWMGYSSGRWEGRTLVIEASHFNDQTWFDRAGDFHSDALKVTERYALVDADHINYEATIDDPKTFTRPWKISLPLYRLKEKNAQLLGFKCVEYSEDLLYKHLYKKD